MAFHQQQHHFSPDPIPPCYRIPLLYIEPILALSGAALLFFNPHRFFIAVSPQESPPDAAFASARILTDMLAAMHVCFAVNLAFVLRYVEHQRDVFRVLCGGMLVSDGLHIAASMREYGLEAMLDVEGWRGHDWVNWGTLFGMLAVRICVVLGIGLGGRGRGEEELKREK